jgi:D-amino peptidase
VTRTLLVLGTVLLIAVMEGVNDSFAAAAFVGYHASEWTPNGVLAHTFSGDISVALNGTTVP